MSHEPDTKPDTGPIRGPLYDTTAVISIYLSTSYHTSFGLQALGNRHLYRRIRGIITIHRAVRANIEVSLLANPETAIISQPR